MNWVILRFHTKCKENHNTLRIFNVHKYVFGVQCWKQTNKKINKLNNKQDCTLADVIGSWQLRIKFLFWASFFRRFAGQWFSCSFCWSQEPHVKVHCMGCSIGLECGRVSFFPQSHVWQANTVKPLLGGPPIKWTPSIKQTLSWVPKRTSDISLCNEPLFSGHLYCIWLYFLLLKTSIKQTPDWINNSSFG